MTTTSAHPDLGRVTTLVHEARRLAEEHRHQSAIEALTEANRLQSTSEVEALLVQMRRRAFEAMQPAETMSSWPPRTDDPFPHLRDELPELAADELTNALVTGGILHHGAVVVRGLLDPSQAPPLIASIDAAFDAQDAVADRDGEEEPASPGDDGRVAEGGLFAPFDQGQVNQAAQWRAWVRRNEAIWAADAPSAMFQVLEVLDAAGIPTLVGEHFGEPPALSVNKFTLRRVPPVGVGTWHQDGAFLGEGVRALNLWVTLTACGGDITDSPSLAVIPRRVDELLDSDSAWVANAVNVTIVQEHFGDIISLPRFDAGDALLFDERFLHLTHRTPGMSRPRYTIETWFFAPSKFPPDYWGLAL